MDFLTAFGLFAVTIMFVCNALERRSLWFVLLFALSCALGSVFGFLQGAWPFWPGRGNLVRGRPEALDHGAILLTFALIRAVAGGTRCSWISLGPKAGWLTMGASAYAN